MRTSSINSMDAKANSRWNILQIAIVIEYGTTLCWHQMDYIPLKAQMIMLINLTLL